MSTFEIKMPKLGESITEGTIVSWSVKVGDAVQEDDVLFEVSTAKVSAEIPFPATGEGISAPPKSVRKYPLRLQERCSNCCFPKAIRWPSVQPSP